MIMGKGIITYQKRLELIDECLRNYERPMTVKEICDECNHCLIREKVVTFRMVKLNMLLSIFLITK